MEVAFSQLGMPHFCLPHITMANESIRKETQHTLLVHARISKGKKKKKKPSRQQPPSRQVAFL
jgi:hypothetical protein